MSRSSSANPKLRDLDSTCWSVVLAAAGEDLEQRDVALQSLCQRYWFPLYGYVRSQVVDVNTAQDLTQEFFAQLLEKDGISTVDPARGRFRWYLLAAIKHFLSNQRKRQRALKRGGDRTIVSLNFADAEGCYVREIADPLTPEKWFDRQWARAVTDAAMEALRVHLHRQGKPRHFEVLTPLLAGATRQTSYEQAGGELGMSAATTRVAVSRMRGLYRGFVRDAIAATVADENEIDEEICQLFAAWEVKR